MRVMRRVQRQLAAAHAEILKKDPTTLFDFEAIRAQAKPGMIATDNTDPVFLVFVKLTASTVADQSGGTAIAVCRGSRRADCVHQAALRSRVGGDVF